MTTLFCGIDPGSTGAMAMLHYGVAPGDLAGIPTLFGPLSWDCPTTQTNSGRTQCDPKGISAIVRAIALNKTAETNVVVAIEAVHAMPKNGSIAGFGLGFSFGMWLGILAAFQITPTLVSPQKWKKEMLGTTDASLPDNKKKDLGRTRAIELFPRAYDFLKLKKHHNRADALLIAAWAARQANQKP